MALMHNKAWNIGFPIETNGEKGFCKQFLNSVKVEEKKSENKPLFLDQFWQQEESQLTSADVSYQMVGLQDYKNASLLYLQYI